MASLQSSPLKLNEAQMVILQLFQHRTMNEQEINALKRTLTRHLTAELDNEIERVMNEKGITAKDVKNRTEGINENRTEYMKALREGNQ
ncbi:hypothetical protein [Runella sp.]|jgi:hypothetical protein|uniref:hypothetical protein n=1 Tax=Runella sp. TaxID=1960881 RepID=UPI002623435A|nr:hypothetical protein [Runella sp.]